MYSNFPTLTSQMNNYNFHQNYQYFQQNETLNHFYNNSINFNFQKQQQQQQQQQQEKIEEMLIYQLNSFLMNKNYLELYRIIEGYNFSKKHHQNLQKLWFDAHYEEAEILKKKVLTPVNKYRIRKKYPLPRTIWDGEETSYCFRETTRKLLKEVFEKSPFPNSHDKELLVKQTELDKDQICNWFKNRRQRDKNLKRQRIKNEKKTTSDDVTKFDNFNSPYTNQSTNINSSINNRNCHDYASENSANYFPFSNKNAINQFPQIFPQSNQIFQPKEYYEELLNNSFPIYNQYPFNGNF